MLGRGLGLVLVNSKVYDAFHTIKLIRHMVLAFISLYTNLPSVGDVVNITLAVFIFQDISLVTQFRLG